LVSIRSTRGVHQIVRFGINTEPVKAHPQLIEDLKRWSVEKTPQALFSRGESISIQDGPFKGLDATFLKLLDEPSGEYRAMILIDILGKRQNLKMFTHYIKTLA